MSELFDRHGGFRRLHSFTLATLVQLETLRFCRRFITHNPREADSKFFDPKGRQVDQMIQAARSGRQRIIELKSQIESQGRAFEKSGGFSERLTARRLEVRNRPNSDAPDCPQCGKPMLRRTSARGDFWGCSAFPACKGMRTTP